MMIQIEKLTKSFGSYLALDNISLSIPQGRLLALLGPSGSGKTTLLRILGGLDRADGGTVWLGGQSAETMSFKDRNIGFVFQHYALFRHMTVADNIAFGLTVRKGKDRLPKAEIQARVQRLLDLIQLPDLGGRYPTQLSGGQRQRVALARALAVQPRLLLLDEPFGALDAQVRKDLRRWLRQLHHEMGLTTIFVTHDQEEALELADEVVVVSQGKIEQIGTPTQIHDHPATPFVHEFLGNTNRLTVSIQNGMASIAHWQVPVPHLSDGEGMAFIRPHDVEVLLDGDDAKIRHIMLLGPTARLELVLHGGTELEITMDRQTLDRLELKENQRIALRARKIDVFNLAYTQSR